MDDTNTPGQKPATFTITTPEGGEFSVKLPANSIKRIFSGDSRSADDSTHQR